MYVSFRIHTYVSFLLFLEYRKIWIEISVFMMQLIVANGICEALQKDGQYFIMWNLPCHVNSKSDMDTVGILEIH